MYALRNAIPRPFLAAQLLFEILLDAIGACDQLFCLKESGSFFLYNNTRAPIFKVLS